MVDVLNWLIGMIAEVVVGLLSLLPKSPFTWDVGSFGKYWSAVNYFIPFGTMAGILVTYVTAISGWYGVRWVLRLARYIQ